MNDNARANADQGAPLDAFTAEFTRAAYDVALWHAAPGTWLDLQLDLWRALADTINRWGPKSCPAQGPLASPDLPHEVIP
jgi:hypothetical protein